MPFCQIESCGRTGLRPTEVEFEEALKKVVCKRCYNDLHPTAKVAAFPVQEMYNRDLAFGLHLTSEEGVKAEVQFQNVLIQAHVPADTVKGWLKIR